MIKLHKIAVSAAMGAGEILRSFFKSNYVVKDKGFHNPVTTADFEADTFLKEYLMSHTTDFGWLSEETVDSKDRLDKEFVWIVDPLDGTKEFIKGIPEFVVSIALIKNHEPILGVIYNPIKDEIIQTTAHGKVLVNGQERMLCTEANLHDVTILNSRSETRMGLWDSWSNVFKGQIPMGSVAYKLALTGSGQNDFFASLRPKNEWDIAAAHAILKANGGILKKNTGDVIIYNQPKNTDYTWNGGRE